MVSGEAIVIIKERSMILKEVERLLSVEACTHTHAKTKSEVFIRIINVELEGLLMKRKNIGSYFVRHTDKLAISDDDLNTIWKQNKIAIHFPGHSPGDGKKDCMSINPEHYKKRSEKGAIACFKELDDFGGYIWAEYRTKKKVKIGEITPGSFDIFKTTWFDNKRKARIDEEAKIKTLQMENVTDIKRGKAMSFRVTRPRGGTIRRWPSIKNRLELLVKKKPIELSWDSLFSEQQETVCSEYLRAPDLEECPCPKLESLLLPIGRTMQDIDIYGLATDKKRIFAQVTHYKKSHKVCKQKKEKLKLYETKDVHLIFFCDCEGVTEENGVLFIPTTKVFEWLKRNKMYLEKLFADLKI